MRLPIRIAILLVGLMLTGAGCREGVTVNTNAKLTMTAPLQGRVSTDMPPRRDSGPLKPMAVDRSAETCPPGQKIALIDVDGVLVNSNQVGPYSEGENPLSLFREKLDAAAADPYICGIVLRINSPGGGVTVCDTMHHELLRFKLQRNIPVVAYLMEVGAGGAYYLATAADAIYAHPTAITGGIGVILNIYNLQDAMGFVNVTSQQIKAGEHIDMGTSLRPLSPDAAIMLQVMANEFHERFKRVVAAARPATAAVPAIFDGRVFTAEQARANGLIDEIGYLDDAIRAVGQRMGQPSARVVMLRRETDPARTPYAVTANRPPIDKLLPMSVPGLDRATLPTFLYLWGIEPTADKGGAK
jgi:protease-4